MKSEEPRSGEDDSVPVPAAIAATAEPVQLDVGLIQDDRVPAEMVCMGTYRKGRLVARAVMSPEAWAQIQEHGFFDEPLQVVLVARVAPPGLQCQLFAMVPLPNDDESDEPDEPWAASVPSSSYEATLAGETAPDEDPRVAPVPLGNIVRTTSAPATASTTPRPGSPPGPRAAPSATAMWWRTRRTGASSILK